MQVSRHPTMSATFYVNTPLDEREHRTLEALAKREGRAKGQQLRSLAISKLIEMGELQEPPKKGGKTR